jgi:hypothetical protein
MPFVRRPWADGHLPVMIVARFGMHTGLAA